MAEITIADQIAAIRDAITWHLLRTETEAHERLMRLQAAIARLEDYAAEREWRQVNGHDEPCVMCGKPCSALAGNPGLWPVRLDNSGWRHTGCINRALGEFAEAKAEIERLRAPAGGDAMEAAYQVIVDIQNAQPITEGIEEDQQIIARALTAVREAERQRCAALVEAARNYRATAKKGYFADDPDFGDAMVAKREAGLALDAALADLERQP